MKKLQNVSELNYMSQIVFLLFEDRSKPEDSDQRYCVTIHFSPGVRCREELLTSQGEATNNLPGSSTPSSSPCKSAPIQSGLVSMGSSGPVSQTSVPSEDNGEPRPKEVHIVRRYSEYVYPIQSRNHRLKKCSLPWSFAPVRADHPSQHGNVKSYSETEITFQERKRKIGMDSNVRLPVYHSSSGGILDSTVHSQPHLDASSLSNGGRRSHDMSLNKSLMKSKLKDFTAGSKQNVTFSIGDGDEGKESEAKEGMTSSNAEMLPESSDNLPSSDSPRISVSGMSGNGSRSSYVVLLCRWCIRFIASIETSSLDMNWFGSMVLLTLSLANSYSLFGLSSISKYSDLIVFTVELKG